MLVIGHQNDPILRMFEMAIEIKKKKNIVVEETFTKTHTFKVMDSFECNFNKG